jgi:uncharacterized protein (TIGR02284 family)
MEVGSVAAMTHFSYDKPMVINMSLESKHDLDAETVAAVQELVQASNDSEKGFREAAEQVDEPQLQQLFLRMSETRKQLANELQSHVAAAGDLDAPEGSWLAAFHRTWMDLRSKLNGGDPKVLLVEAERGEDYIKHAYEDVLKRTAGSALNDVLQRQYAVVKRGHDSIRDLRDAFVAAR